MGASKKSKSKRSKLTVGFEDETVKKEDARVILKENSVHKVTETTTSLKATQLSEGMDSVKQKRKKKKGTTNETKTNLASTEAAVESEIADEFVTENDGHQSKKVGKDSTSKKLKKKRHSDSDNLQNGNTEDAPSKKKKKKDVDGASPQEDTDLGDNEPSDEKKESIRAQKRRKHAELLSQKKMKAELKMQQNALNYLSKWKHSRSDWKFEKLRQIWLQQNLYDTAKITKEFWDVTLEYFAGSKGATRDAILKEAIKIIDTDEQLEGSNEDEDYQVKLQRARDLIQHLQE